MKTLTIAGLLALAACGSDQVTIVQSCSIEDTSEGVAMTCGDVTELVRHGSNGLDGANGVDGVDGLDGTNGLDGVDGQDGANGLDGQDGVSPILAIIDPCGDNPGKPDEVLFQLDSGIAAWYQDIGLVLLGNRNYITTDEQACRFRITNGQYSE